MLNFLYWPIVTICITYGAIRNNDSTDNFIGYSEARAHRPPRHFVHYYMSVMRDKLGNGDPFSSGAKRGLEKYI